jgi:hypothetical protein
MWFSRQRPPRPLIITSITTIHSLTITTITRLLSTTLIITTQFTSLTPT